MDEAFSEILDRRLDGDGPLGVAVSGGGDSLALLYRLAEWGRRPLHVFCVDHRLNPASAEWTRTVADHAHRVEAVFTGLAWTGAKPSNGLSAAARTARHALLAEAAREAGVRVLCLAHTHDDGLEAAWMRAQGSNVTAPAEWSPSPVWPQGRGVFLLRPLLKHSRASLRDDLTARRIAWIDDPANANPQSLRVQARLAEKSTSPSPETLTVAADLMARLLDRQWAAYGLIALRRPVFDELPPALVRKVLAAAAVCAGGGDKLPRGDSMEVLMADLAPDRAPDLAPGRPRTLCGARIWQTDARIFAVREAGDIDRRNAAPLNLSAAIEAMWDGRYAIRVQSGGTVEASSVARRRLREVDRTALSRLPARLRGILPVLDEKFPDPALPNARLLGQTHQMGIDCTNCVVSRFMAACGVVDSESRIGLDLAEPGRVAL